MIVIAASSLGNRRCRLFTLDRLRALPRAVARFRFRDDGAPDFEQLHSPDHRGRGETRSGDEHLHHGFHGHGPFRKPPPRHSREHDRGAEYAPGRGDLLHPGGHPLRTAAPSDAETGPSHLHRAWAPSERVTGTGRCRARGLALRRCGPGRTPGWSGSFSRRRDGCTHPPYGHEVHGESTDKNGGAQAQILPGAPPNMSDRECLSIQGCLLRRAGRHSGSYP